MCRFVSLSPVAPAPCAFGASRFGLSSSYLRAMLLRGITPAQLATSVCLAFPCRHACRPSALAALHRAGRPHQIVASRISVVARGWAGAVNAAHSEAGPAGRQAPYSQAGFAYQAPQEQPPLGGQAYNQAGFPYQAPQEQPPLGGQAYNQAGFAYSAPQEQPELQGTASMQAGHMEVPAAWMDPGQYAEGAPPQGMLQRGAQQAAQAQAPAPKLSPADAEMVWRDVVENPGNWWDNRLKKKNPRAPDFVRKVDKLALWVTTKTTPAWVPSTLPQAGSPYTQS
jgi:hypothetical protein